MRLLVLVKQTYASFAITTAHPAQQLGEMHPGHNTDYYRTVMETYST